MAGKTVILARYSLPSGHTMSGVGIALDQHDLLYLFPVRMAQPYNRGGRRRELSRLTGGAARST